VAVSLALVSGVACHNSEPSAITPLTFGSVGSW